MQSNCQIQNIVYTFSGGATGVSLLGCHSWYSTWSKWCRLEHNLSYLEHHLPIYPVQQPITMRLPLIIVLVPRSSTDGSIEVRPADRLTVSSPTTDAQQICVGTGTGTLENIVYNLENGATGATVVGLPPGVGYTVL